MSTETFHLSDLLSIYSGYLVSREHIGGVYKILNHMTGDDLMTHQLPLACDAVKPDLLEQHPWLAEVAAPEKLSGEAECITWVASVAEKYGEYHEVAACPSSWGQHDPISDFTNQYPNTPIIGVTIQPGDEADRG